MVDLLESVHYSSDEGFDEEEGWDSEEAAHDPDDEEKIPTPKVKTSPFRSVKNLQWYHKDQGQPCKPGETAARSGCIPASGDGGKKPRAGGEESSNQSSQSQEEERARPQPKTAPPPEGEKITEAPCCLHDVDPHEVEESTGVTKASRVGVPGMSSPPPPDEIPRLPNLTEKEREAEGRFAETYLSNPDGVAMAYRQKLQAKEVGDAPNVFNTDDAKLLSPDYNPKDVDPDEVKNARGTYNAVVHQTANAIAKRAFLQYLDEVVLNLPDDQKTVLVTSGGVAAGKGYALKNVDQTKSLADKVGAIWDAAGEQNATENPWILEECKKRGIHPVFAYIHANPQETWENPKRGVVERANNIGRMVDAQLFADSYSLGAKNFDAFYKANRDSGDCSFFILDNSSGAPQISEQMPEAALNQNSDEIYMRASRVLDERAENLRPSVVRGGSIGRRVWGEPLGGENA